MIQGKQAIALIAEVAEKAQQMERGAKPVEDGEKYKMRPIIELETLYYRDSYGKINKVSYLGDVGVDGFFHVERIRDGQKMLVHRSQLVPKGKLSQKELQQNGDYN